MFFPAECRVRLFIIGCCGPSNTIGVFLDDMYVGEAMVGADNRGSELFWEKSVKKGEGIIWTLERKEQKKKGRKRERKEWNIKKIR